MPDPFIDHLIVDSSGFIHHGPIRETGKNIYSCKEVIEEIKDKTTLESLKFLPYELKLLQFDKDDLDFCIEFSKKTGDYKQLSIVDLKLIAATYRLEKQYNGFKHINKEPKQVAVKPLAKPKSKHQSIEESLEKLSQAMNATNISEFDPLTDSQLAKILDDEAGSSGKSSDSDDSDQAGGWINPQNISKVYKKMGFDKPANITAQTWAGDRVVVACMTSDFSIQNCLLQMGLLVVSPIDGLMIKEAKKIALRCHACFKVFHDLTKIKNDFCPHCGNLDTLKRVQYIVDKDGAKKVLVNFKRPIKVKGTNKQLPKPRGGKHANNPILTADQKVRRDKQDKFVVQEKKTVTAEHILHDPAYLVRTNPFVYRSNQTKGKR